MGLWTSLRHAFRSTAIAVGGDVPYTYGGTYGSSYGWWPGSTPSTRIDYKQEAGDLIQSTIVQAALSWLARTFPESHPRVMRTIKSQSEPVNPHPLTELLRNPNPYYNGLLLWQPTILSLNLDGNAYWIKQRNGSGKLLELWYEPHMTIRPRWPQDGSGFISGYQIKRKGMWLDQIIPPEDVVHFRNGIDPRNPRMGLSPLSSAFREIFTDNEAANFSASLLRNLGVPGVIVSPKEGYTIDDEEDLKEKMVAKFGGDKRGEPLVLAGPMQVDVLSWSPEQMNLEKLRRLPEERITALLGIPAVVAGMGAGLDRSTYSNMQEAREEAYEGNLLPTQRLLAAQLETDLLPELGDPKTETVSFDTSAVRALADDQTDLMKRSVIGFRGGVLMRSEARRLTGSNLDTTPEDDMYITDILDVSKSATELNTVPGVSDSTTTDRALTDGNVRALAVPDGEKEALTTLIDDFETLTADVFG